MEKIRQIIISDVHGCLDELNELVKLISFNPYKDRLIFVGDFLDRGPYGPEVLRRVRELGAESVLANHELKYIRYYNHEMKKIKDKHYKNPMHFNKEKMDQYNALSPDDWHYIKSLPSYLKINDGNKDVYVVHAGMEPYKPIQAQNYKFMTMIRYVTSKGDFISDGTYNKPAGDGIESWYNLWCRTENIIYGHQARLIDSPLITNNTVGGKTYGIDLGCVFGGKLCALILPTYEIATVNAKKQYCEMHE